MSEPLDQAAKEVRPAPARGALWLLAVAVWLQAAWPFARWTGVAEVGWWSFLYPALLAGWLTGICWLTAIYRSQCGTWTRRILRCGSAAWLVLSFWPLVAQACLGNPATMGHSRRYLWAQASVFLLGSVVQAAVWFMLGSFLAGGVLAEAGAFWLKREARISTGILSGSLLTEALLWPLAFALVHIPGGTAVLIVAANLMAGLGTMTFAAGWLAAVLLQAAVGGRRMDSVSAARATEPSGKAWAVLPAAGLTLLVAGAGLLLAGHFLGGRHAWGPGDALPWGLVWLSPLFLTAAHPQRPGGRMDGWACAAGRALLWVALVVQLSWRLPWGWVPSRTELEPFVLAALFATVAWVLHSQARVVGPAWLARAVAVVGALMVAGTLYSGIVTASGGRMGSWVDMEPVVLVALLVLLLQAWWMWHYVKKPGAVNSAAGAAGR